MKPKTPEVIDAAPPVALSIAKIHRINQAHIAIAQSFAQPNNGTPPNGSPLRTFGAKLTLARNLNKLREALEPVEDILTKERARLMEKTKGYLPNANELGPEEAALFLAFVKEANAKELGVVLEKILHAELNENAFDGPAAIDALSALDGIVLVESIGPTTEKE